MKRTKIICTIGPASESVESIKAMAVAGMDIVRINLSHGTEDDLLRYINHIQQAAKELGKTIPVLLDTQGPEVRIGSFAQGKVQLVAGQLFTLTTDKVLGNDNRVWVQYDSFIDEVEVGMGILLNDGLIHLKVREINDKQAVCHVLVGGQLSDHKKINIPEISFGLPSLSKMDKDKICAGLKGGFDFIAGSYIRTAGDVKEIKAFLSNTTERQISIIAKIENQSGIDHLEEILDAADGIMVARGDLGVEIKTETVPIVQKQIIDKCNRYGKPVITATQMLESMIQHVTPTRAEVSDVANAILDGTDAIMLSGETAVGKYSLQAVETMKRIAIQVENIYPFFKIPDNNEIYGVTDVICQSAVSVASQLNAKAIITPTHSGYSARHIAKYRPQAAILAVTDQEQVYRQLFLMWGVEPFQTSFTHSTDIIMDKAINRAQLDHRIESGDYIVITAGVPFGVTGTTNLVKVHQV